MGYKNTLLIEEDVIRVLKSYPNSTAEQIANKIGTTEEYVRQGISHLRKNVLLPNEAIVTHFKKKMTTGKSCTYEFIDNKTSRFDGVTQMQRSYRKTARLIREISKLSSVIIATTNPAEARVIRLQIADLMTNLSREMNLANMGMLPGSNAV